MIIRKANKQDIDSIMKIVDDAKLYLHSKRINQWVNNYPNPSTFENDILNDALYVLEDEEVIGVFAMYHYEKTYDVIEGKWLNDEPYVVIHRVAIKDDLKGNGYVSYIFDYLKERYNNIRIDTHDQNESMKRCILKNGFKYCGIITLESKDLRNAYHYQK